MRLRSLLALTSLAAAVPLMAAAAPPPEPSPQKSAAQNSAAPVTLTPIGGHLLGNPKARTKIVEYASYTCPHCAMFEAEGAPAIKANYVRRGLASFELRNLIRDPVDLTTALLARCGPTSRFFANHELIMRNQPVWLSAAQTSTPETRKSWFEGSYGERMGKIAKDTGLFKLMQSNGYTSAQLNACLSDEAAQKTVSAMTEDAQKLGVKGTPSFLLNGKLLDGVYSWQALKPLLPAA